MASDGDQDGFMGVQPDVTEGPGTVSNRRATLLVDVLGALLWAGLLGWVVTTARTPDAAAPLRDLLLLTAAAYVLARLVSRLHPWAVHVVVATAVTTVAVWHLGGMLSVLAIDPLGYANASAALYLTGCACALVVVARARRREMRTAATCSAVVCAVLPWADTAFAAGLLVLPMPAALVSRELGVRVRQVILTSAAVALLALGATVAIGTAWRSGSVIDVVVAQTLSGNRAQLWSEALDLMVSSPGRGVGTNRFAAASPTASGDEDLRWAHNEYLQLGAETGAPGLALAVALLVWVFLRLAVGPRDQGTAVAAIGLAGASITASIDYVWHFPAVLVAVAALAGAGGGVRRQRLTTSRDVDDRERWIDATVAGDALWPQQLDHRPADDPQVEHQ
jgi:O-antigen ligase